MRSHPIAKRFAFVLLTPILGFGCSGPLVSQDRKADPIKDAIRKGVANIEARFSNDDFKTEQHSVGVACLGGLALLESDVKKDNASLTRIARYVRAQALKQTATYEVALSAMFLEQFGEPADKPLVQFLGVRLLAGQGMTGGWEYSCGEPLPPEDETLLRDIIDGKAQLPEIDKKEPKTPEKKTDPNKPSVVPKQKDDKQNTQVITETESLVHPAVARFLRLVPPHGRPDANNTGDHSNTQFAIVGLWCARRTGLNVDVALRRAESRFRKSQSGDGGWAYNLADRSSSATMTCSGLMGLSLGNAIKERSDSSKNLRTQNAPVPLQGDNRNENKVKIEDQAILRGLARLEGYLVQEQLQQTATTEENYYLLWSVERVGMALGLERIGRVDWYRWGAERLIRKQGADGGWTGGSYAGSTETISTCFALLFLNRANLTKELTKSLRSRPDLSVGDGGSKESTKGSPRGNVPMPVEKRGPNSNPGNPEAAVKKEDANTKPSPSVEDAAFNAEADRLCMKLLKTGAGERDAVIAELRDSKGPVYTEALIRAAGQSPQTLLIEIREALAQRLKRMTKTTLKDMLKDGNKEIRLAAAKAVGLKQESELIGSLIDLLGDTEANVAQAARQSLKTLSNGKDFGPKIGADADEKLKAITAWRVWAKQN